jgi:hypothetical protein
MISPLVKKSTIISGNLPKNRAYALFFDKTGPTHTVTYEDRIPIKWKDFNLDDMDYIIKTILKADVNDLKRVPVLYGHLAYTYQTASSSGYGIILPGGKRMFHAKNESYITSWPTLVVEYPAMRVYALKGKALHYWEMPHISSSSQICVGGVYIDYRLKDIDKIYNHISKQIWGATWAYYTKKKINLHNAIKQEICQLKS